MTGPYDTAEDRPGGSWADRHPLLFLALLGGVALVLWLVARGGRGLPALPVAVSVPPVPLVSPWSPLA